MMIASGAERVIHAPADGVAIGSVREATLDDVIRTVAVARRALDGWRRAAPHDRSAILSRAAMLLEDQAGELALIHARESGKVITEARREVLGAAALLSENAHVGRFDAGYLAPTGALPGGERDLTLVERVRSEERLVGK